VAKSTAVVQLDGVVRGKDAPGSGGVEADPTPADRFGQPDPDVGGLAPAQSYPEIGRREVEPFRVGNDHDFRATADLGPEFVGHRYAANSGAKDDDSGHASSESYLCHHDRVPAPRLDMHQGCMAPLRHRARHVFDAPKSALQEKGDLVVGPR